MKRLTVKQENIKDMTYENLEPQGSGKIVMSKIATGVAQVRDEEDENIMYEVTVEKHKRSRNYTFGNCAAVLEWGQEYNDTPCWKFYGEYIPVEVDFES